MDSIEEICKNEITLLNVNGVRAAAGKTLVEDLHKLDCDVVGLQETKATPEQVKEALSELQGYYIYAFSAEKKDIAVPPFFLR